MKRFLVITVICFFAFSAKSQSLFKNSVSVDQGTEFSEPDIKKYTYFTDPPKDSSKSIMKYSNRLIELRSSSSIVEYWSINGNTGTNPGEHFIGTTDATDFLIKTNAINIEVSPIARFSGDDKYRIMLGKGNIADNEFSLATGLNTKAEGHASVSTGEKSNATGDISTATGFNTIASGRISTALGNSNIARAYGETVLGMFNKDQEPNSTIAYTNLDRLFSIGNGKDENDRRNAMVVMQNGNIGIGTDEPGQKLDVLGNVNVKGNINFSDLLMAGGSAGNAGQFLMSNGPGSTPTWNTIPSSIPSQWSNNGLSIYYNSGNVGIGEATPATKLHVNGTITATGLKLTGGVTGNILAKSSTGEVVWQAPTWIANGNNIQSDNSGFVLIGRNSNVTIDPSGYQYKLYVENGIRTRKVKVDHLTNWPDFVFEEDYHLPTLKEVEEFIRSEKHLIGVKSAEEITKEGIDLGDNQAVLLQKIEELTLYLIEQNKKISKQQKQIDELKNQMDNPAPAGTAKN